jgi:hypothetical protein
MKKSRGISTRDLGLLPPPDRLLKLSQSLAILDAIIQPEWHLRYYSFNAHWDDALGHQMASMSNGSGDSYFLLFNAVSAAIIGDGHESAMAAYFCDTGGPPPGLFDGLPSEFVESVAKEPAFSPEEATFCLWNRNNEGWKIGNVELPDGDDPDGSAELLAILEGRSEQYVLWAREYYERRLRRDIVELIYQQEPLTADLVKNLNRKMTLAKLEEDIQEIGYPVCG